MCGIDLISLAIGVIVLLALYYILILLPFFAPFTRIIQILIGALAAIFIIVRVIAPLFSCMV